MPSVTYDADGKQRRAMGCLTFCVVVFFALTFLFAYAWRLSVGPYTKFKVKCDVLHKKAQTDKDSPNCRDPALRAQLEGYNNCERSEIILTRSCRITAFYDLMNYLSFCDENNQCKFAGINWTDSLYSLVRIGFIACVALYIASVLGIVTYSYGRSVGVMQLPMNGVSGGFTPIMVAAPPPQHQLRADAAEAFWKNNAAMQRAGGEWHSTSPAHSAQLVHASSFANDNENKIKLH